MLQVHKPQTGVAQQAIDNIILFTYNHKFNFLHLIPNHQSGISNFAKKCLNALRPFFAICDRSL